ncbi:MAG: ribokinase [Chloroflexi bacterium GWB2_49_20]|nr:MAG: ribokinase [Chloroflexi bacterium GWB2_49_20]OGN78612.1 MAG: ribokinase [Chloroflexi bacterium GWC2_49_37]OGN85714.1 MAG: ribokinase [Chloroflexi bacterium GWD2_49_16]HBG75063.1 carbohydrate kinase family protein [Anaerolineae bacterium]HCC78088.1 carbohydrate kinase family protein [Anaerolineae bacterium]
MNILLTGSVAYDYLMTFPGLFKEQILPERLGSISLSFLVNSMSRQRGGVAPNIAYTLAMLGEAPYLMATVGEDFNDYRDWLESKGVDTSLVVVVPGVFTASFFATTDEANAQIASFYPGAMAYAAEQSLKTLEEKPDLVVVSPNDPEAMKNFAAECRELGIPYLYDPSQQILRLSGEEILRDMKGAHFLFVNDYESGLIMKKTGLSLDEILKIVNVVVVTRGEKGTSIYTEGKEINLSVVPPQQIVDPTGVGDAFRGGFLAGYSNGWSWETCGKMGALAATYCLEKKGTQNHTFTRDEFVARFRKHFNDDGLLDELVR